MARRKKWNPPAIAAKELLVRRRAGILTLCIAAALLALALGCGEGEPGRQGPDGALTRIDVPPADVLADFLVHPVPEPPSPADGAVSRLSDESASAVGEATGSPPEPAPAAVWLELEPSHGALVSARMDTTADSIAPPNRPKAHRRHGGVPAPEMADLQASGENLEIYFDKESEVVNPAYYGVVERVAKLLQEQPEATAVLEGHADSRGSGEYNQKLSQRRAEAVATLLTERHGVDASRVRAVGLGEGKPLAANDTAEGRARNRSVIPLLRDL